jgi:hypothetical protein
VNARRHIWSALASFASLASCAAPRVPITAAASRAEVAAPASASASAPAPAPKRPSLDVRIAPFTEGELGMHVVITADSDVAMRAWSRSNSTLGSIDVIEVRDALGRVGISPTRAGWMLARAPEGPVTFRYDLHLRATERSPALAIFSDRFVAHGEALLILPEALDDVRVHTSIAIDGAPLHAAKAASSLGVGELRSAERPGRFLRHATFMAGSLGTAILDASEGHDEAAWLGYTAFDVRAVVGELAQARTGFADYFRSGYEVPMTYFVVGEARPLGHFRVAARAESVVLSVGAGEPWSAPLRVAVAQQMLHTWIGGVLWVGPADAEHEAEAAWFVDGVSRFLAVRLLRRFGLLSPGEARDAVVAALSEQATSPYGGQPNVRVAAQNDRTSRALLAARGALYAMRVDGEIRRASGGKRSIDDVLHALYARAREAGNALPASAWVDAVARELGAAAAPMHAKLIDEGAAVVLADDALGRCFRAAKTTYARFEIGFDDVRTEDDPMHRVAGVVAESAAARAGLRDGDILESSDAEGSDPDRPVKLRVSQAGVAREITYTPRGSAHAGTAFARVAGIADEACP